MNTNDSLGKFIKEHSFFDSLSEKELAYIVQHSIAKKFKAGEFLIREHDINSDIYIIKKGPVEIYKELKGYAEPMLVGTVETGELIGELAYLDDSPRSVSVKAINDAEIVILPKDMTEEKNKLAQSIKTNFLYNIALLSSTRLKNQTLVYGDTLRKQIDLLQEQVHFGTLFVYMIILFGMNGFVLDIIQNHFGQYYFFTEPTFDLLYERLIAWAGFIIFAAPVIILIKKINFPIKKVLNLRTNLKSSVVESLIISAVFAIPILLFTTGIISVSGIPLLNDKVTPYWLLTAITPDYLLHSYVQELVARGIMQNAIQQFLRDEKGHKTVFVSALAFGVMHAHLGLGVVFATAVGSIGFGYLYLHQKNLVGVTIVHYSTGVLLRYINILRIFQ